MGFKESGMDFAAEPVVMKQRISIAIMVLTLCGALSAAAQQLDYMNFDRWSKSDGVWYPYPASATDGHKTWDSANKGLSLLGINSTTPEYDHVAVAGKGKAAAKLESKKVLWAFVGGNLFTGHFEKVVGTSGAQISFGVPFHARPRSLTGYFHYIPGTVNYAKPPYAAMKGRQDQGFIEIFLTDWTEPYFIDSTKGNFLDIEKDPHVIGFGVLNLKEGTEGYIPFEIPVKYRSGKTPTHIVIICTPSRYGEFYTGSSKSVLYVDEFRLNY